MQFSEAVQFLSGNPDPSLLYHSSYQPWLIVASVLIAICGAYAALVVASRIQNTEQRSAQYMWISIGAVALGIGIWAMHFIGMLSLKLPCRVSYDTSTTLLSMLPSVLASGVALSVISKRDLGPWSLRLGSLLLGAGIGIMHYSGMAAMQLDGYLRYDPLLFILSILVAVLLAYIALKVKVHSGRKHDLLGALIMGAAISGMHYTAMAASYFLRGDLSDLTDSYLNQTYLAMAIIVVTSLVTTLATVAAIAHRNLEVANREERWRLALEGSGEAVWDWNMENNRVAYSSHWKHMLGYSNEELGTKFHDWERHIHPDDLTAFRVDMADYLAKRKSSFVNENRLRCQDGSWLWVVTRGSVTACDNNGRPLRMVGTNADISKRKHTENREQTRNYLLEMLSKGAALPELLQAALHGVQSHNPQMLCSILLLDSEGKRLHTAAAPSLPAFYNHAINGVHIGMNVGSCGTAAFLGERVIVEDIQTHPCWKDYRELAEQAELRSCWSEPIRSSSGRILGTFAIYQRAISSPDADDILLIEQTARLVGLAIDRSNANAELQLASLVYQNSGEAMMVTDASGTIIGINPAFTNLTGYALNDVIGQDYSILHCNRHDEYFYQDLRNAINSAGHWQGELWSAKKGGDYFAGWLTINTITNEDGTPHRRVALFSDITERKKSEELIWHQANFDSLTGLPNRRMFQEKLEHELKKSHRNGMTCALLFLDIDRFKEVNDTLGHDVGDTLLKEVALRINNAVRETDTVARLGGDEFTIILAELESIEHVDRIARDILHKLAEPFLIHDQQVFTSASIGITFYPQDADSMDVLIKNADQAMYAAKNKGRNCHVYFVASMQEKLQARMQMCNSLRTAIVEEQFRVLYQPIINLKDGTIDKAEALIRWEHPSQGCVSPADFIPIAEDTGLIMEIGDWVFCQAVAQATLWRHRYSKDFQISVNKSPVQLRNDTTDHIQCIHYLAQQHLPGQAIVFEITEGLLLDASTTVSGKLLEYRDAGLQVAIDDFGTGYSSLSYLKKFDIDFIKIDRSFVGNLSIGSEDLALCEAMIVMAHKLGMKVIAEGIEQQQQLDLLKSIGCDYGQGYLFSRPLSSVQFEEFIEHWEKIQS